MDEPTPRGGNILYIDRMRPAFIWWLYPMLAGTFLAIGLVGAAAGQLRGLVFAACGLAALLLGARPLFTCRLEVRPGEIYVLGMTWYAHEVRLGLPDVVEVRPFKFRDQFSIRFRYPDIWAIPRLSPRCMVRGVSRSAIVTPTFEQDFYRACARAGFAVEWPPHLFPEEASKAGW